MSKPSDLVQGTLDMLVLKTLTRGAMHGYTIAEFIQQSSADVLLRGIRVVASGKTYLDPELTGHIVEKVIDRHFARGGLAKRSLSPREEEVLRLVAWGFLNKEIAGRLQISVKTAETHKANAMEKLALKNRVEIVRHAVLQGWLQDT